MSSVANASIFTNNMGQVIFVDEAFLSIMQYPEAGAVTGEPLAKVLHLDQQTGKHLLEDVRKQKILRDQMLDIKDQAGKALRLSANIIATFDPHGNFLGADIMLRRADSVVVAAPAETEKPRPSQSAALFPSISKVETKEMAGTSQFLDLYFTTHIKAFYVLYQRLIGLMARDNLDKLINQTAQKNGSTLQIKNGLFTTSITGTKPEVYRAILREMMNYGVNMIGQSVVIKAVDKVDEEQHEGVLALAKQENLYQLYKQ